MKTYVLDASALVAFLRDQPGASRVDELLREAMSGRTRVLMSAVNYGEVYGLIVNAAGLNSYRLSLGLVLICSGAPLYSGGVQQVVVMPFPSVPSSELS